MKKNTRAIQILILLPICLWLLKISLPGLLLGIGSMAWPETNGVVMESSIVERKVEKGSLWKPEIVYDYLVENQKYRGDRISYSFFTFGKAWASKIIDKYNPSDNIQVYYNPRKPQISCVDPGPDKWYCFYVLLGFGGIFYLIFSIFKGSKKAG